MAPTDSQAPGAGPGTAHPGRPTGLKSLLDANRTPTIVTSRMRSYLHEQELTAPMRSTDVLHPSEICKDGWCPRAAYLKLVSPPTRESVTFKQRLVFENGHSSHRRFQRWLGNTGALEGYWICQMCDFRFYQKGVPRCGNCGAPRCAYDELPLEDPARLIEGSTDGLLYEDDAVLEIKTVGIGTVRYANPQLLRSNTYTVDGRQIIDYDRIWDSIRRPFADHVRQGSLYTHCLRLQPRYRTINKMVFLYEWKATNDIKEFVVRYNEALIRPVLIRAEQIAAAVDGRGQIPSCRDGENLCVECMKVVVS